MRLSSPSRASGGGRGVAQTQLRNSFPSAPEAALLEKRLQAEPSHWGVQARGPQRSLQLRRPQAEVPAFLPYQPSLVMPRHTGVPREGHLWPSDQGARMGDGPQTHQESLG